MIRDRIGDSLISTGETVKSGGMLAALGRIYWLMACAGAIVIGVTLPTLLVCWNASTPLTSLILDGGGPISPSIAQVMEDFILVEIIATVGCGPGALCLGLLLYGRLSRRAKEQQTEASALIKRGLFFGMGLAYLNLPGYLAIIFMPSQDHPDIKFAKIMLLFAVSGASCGVWIAWQAYRSAHEGERFLPRFTLSTLMGLVFGWGLLMAVFAPR